PLPFGLPLGTVGGNYGTEIERGLSELRVVRPELLAERVADLADRAARPERLSHRDEEVPLACRDLSDLGQRGGRLVRVPLCPHPRRPLDLTPLGLGIELVQLDRLRLRLDEGVHSDDHALAGLDLRRVPIGGFLDLAL